MNNLNFNEKVVFGLRSLYESFGYTQYKMSKFEEYDLYAKNKDFLISDGVITFTDTTGKLMALKPDVTLSIIKNTKDLPDCVQKVYYDENVYRISKSSHSFKEIMQAGLECFGDIDDYCILEVLTLALESLKSISGNAVLDISELSVLAELLGCLEISKTSCESIIKCIGEKNLHGLEGICNELGIEDRFVSALKCLITTSGKPQTVLPKLINELDGLIDTTPLIKLSDITAALKGELAEMLNLDFSVVGDMNYYNGIVFKGFIEGVPASVLSGGRYDKLMKKMKRRSGAVGFAVYLDMLERLGDNKKEYDIDTFILYDGNTPIEKTAECVKAYNGNKSRVLAGRQIPSGIKYKNLVNLCEGEDEDIEKNA